VEGAWYWWWRRWVVERYADVCCRGSKEEL